MNERHRVAILVHTSTSWGTQLIDGIADYAQQHGSWLFYVEPRGVYERLRLPRGWSGGGIIARVTTEALAPMRSLLPGSLRSMFPGTISAVG
ncbi:MAG: hypothetical protein JW829_12745 [Pirellulales bacterium]|nr:hypothetical protein [Pirellulales bacterium]